MDKLGITWFDGVVVALVIVGFFIGRKRGMSNELLDLFQWLLMLVVPALYYKMIGDALIKIAPMSLFLGYITVYLGMLICIKLTFTVIKRIVGEKLVGSDLFGRLEFYLGMLAGMLRFFCMAVMIISVAGAPFIRPEEVEANRQKQIKELGSTFFPSMGEIQRDVVYKSIVGQFARKHLSNQLFEPVAAGQAPAKAGITKQREKAVDDVMNGGKK